MPARIVTARAPKRIRKPTKAGPKLSRVIVGKAAQAMQEPESPEAYPARGDAADRLWREMVARVSRKNPPAYEGRGGKFAVETRRRNREKKPPSETDF